MSEVWEREGGNSFFLPGGNLGQTNLSPEAEGEGDVEDPERQPAGHECRHQDHHLEQHLQGR